MPRATKNPCGIKTGQYRSKLEARVAKNLEDRGVAFGYEEDSVNYTLPPKRYIPDFRIPRPCPECRGNRYVTLGPERFPCDTCKGEGKVFRYIEVKGWFRGCDRTKLLAVKKANPGIDLRLLFQRAKSPINKGSKTTYAMWAEANGFPWAEGVVPEAWLNTK